MLPERCSEKQSKAKQKGKRGGEEVERKKGQEISTSNKEHLMSGGVYGCRGGGRDKGDTARLACNFLLLAQRGASHEKKATRS